MAPHSHPILVTDAPAEAAAATDAATDVVWSKTYENPLFYAAVSLGPQGYAAFLREHLTALKAAEPELAHRERVRRAAAAWQVWKRAVRKAARG
jgi:hypothetical protein